MHNEVHHSINNSYDHLNLTSYCVLIEPSIKERLDISCLIHVISSSNWPSNENDIGIFATRTVHPKYCLPFTERDNCCVNNESLSDFHKKWRVRTASSSCVHCNLSRYSPFLYTSRCRCIFEVSEVSWVLPKVLPFEVSELPCFRNRCFGVFFRCFPGDTQVSIY